MEEPDQRNTGQPSFTSKWSVFGDIDVGHTFSKFDVLFLKIPKLPYNVMYCSICPTVLVQYWHMTDRQADTEPWAYIVIA